MSYRKYYVYKQQYSEDGGRTWKDTDPLVTSPSGDPIGEYATLEECQGLTPTGKKLVATYTGGITNEVECNDNTTLTTSETKPSGYVYSAMTSAVIGDCVTSIDEDAFSYCSGLTSVTIPNSVTFIDEDAFSYCRSLTSITIPSSVTTIGGWAFDECRSLTSITIPNSVTSIGSYAFVRCSGLTSVTCLATTPPSLGTSVFDNTNDCPIYVPCQSVDLYKSASRWSTYASRIQGIPPCGGNKKLVANYNGGRTNEVDCNSSTELTSGETKPSGYQASAMTSAVIGDCVTSIGGFAFAYCSGLTSISILDSVTSIGIAAFQLCRSLTSITIPDSVTNIDNSAFMSCYSLRSIDIPSGVTSITEGLFFECSGLTSVTIGSSVTSIGKQAFEDCYNLTSVTIPNSVTSIAYAAFDDCRRLRSIDIPNSVASIGSYAFIRCSGATSCVIGSGVTSIGEWAFASCHSLTSIIINATTPPSLGTSVFYNTNCPIYVPAASVNAYKTAENWSTYASRIQPIT